MFPFFKKRAQKKADEEIISFLFDKVSQKYEFDCSQLKIDALTGYKSIEDNNQKLKYLCNLIDIISQHDFLIGSAKPIINDLTIPYSVENYGYVKFYEGEILHENLVILYRERAVKLVIGFYDFAKTKYPQSIFLQALNEATVNQYFMEYEHLFFDRASLLMEAFIQTDDLYASSQYLFQNMLDEAKSETSRTDT
ncbi:hypothetical protein [Vibrio splendidus]|uniref:hypothetical protein n=1 Tax=Vibrio splendidus TaxID=29497 RepID=UPI001FB3B73E|nr:hypothetical protein [Vibrio splendidus]UOE84238.1 hypothetical protein LTQ54_15050 [Vibrio splendidus]